jgi:hypothetical protein
MRWFKNRHRAAKEEDDVKLEASDSFEEINKKLA